MAPYKRKKPHEDGPADADAGGEPAPAPRRTTRQTAVTIPELEKMLRSARPRADAPEEPPVEASIPPQASDTNHDAQKVGARAMAPRAAPAKPTRRKRGQQPAGGEGEVVPIAAEITVAPNSRKGRDDATPGKTQPGQETTGAPAPAEAAVRQSPPAAPRQSRPNARRATSASRPQTRKPRKTSGSVRSSVPMPGPGGPASTSAAALASSMATPNRRISAVAQSHKPPLTPQGDRNINRVIFGDISFRTWYPSYYGKDVLGGTTGTTGAKDDYGGPTKVGGGKKEKEAMLDRLFVCPCCFKYSRDEPLWQKHFRLCEKKALVPGCQIYTHPKPRNHAGHTRKHAKVKGDAGATAEEEVVTKNEGEWSVWEVDGEKEPLFCQNLSLFAKLFLDNKSVFFDVAGFNYFLLVYTPPPAAVDHPASEAAEASQATPARLPSLRRPQIVGFFSKEKLSWDNNNVACILVFPPWQRKGLGVLLMGVSYEISRREGLLGGPEKPISELGKKGYKRFWAGEITRWFLGLQGPENDEGETVVDVDECSKATWIAPEDCLAVLRDVGIVEEAGPGLPKAVPEANGEAEGDKGKEKEQVPRVKIDKAAVRRWVESQKIDLQRACDPNGFLEGYAVKKQEVEEEDI